MTTPLVKILTVEDDELLADMLCNLLEEAGYEPLHFNNANSALEWLKTHKPALIISDIGLPGLSGTQFCRLLKSEAATAAIPLIMLTSLDGEANKVQALKAGADDYIVKPFSNDELLARVEALLRRAYHNGRLDRQLVSGAIVVNIDTGVVTLDGRPLQLLPKEFSLLVMFLTRKNHILPYCFIAEAVWGNDCVATRDTIKVTVHRLRSKLGTGSGSIEPVPGTGYRWVEDI